MSRDKVTWIEARKFCEMKSASLLVLASEARAVQVSSFLRTRVRRHYNEFWTAGNDIAREGDWVWAEAGARVPEFGWSEQSRAAVEENCLVWVVEMAGAGAEDGWHGASCCNMHQYVCQLL